MKIISGKQMCRVLERRGWTLARINGSHQFIAMPQPDGGRSCRSTAIRI